MNYSTVSTAHENSSHSPVKLGCYKFYLESSAVVYIQNHEVSGPTPMCVIYLMSLSAGFIFQIKIYL